MEKFDWHYIGQFGQLGPLSEAQVRDLIRDGVVLGDTFLWKSPMADWQRARSLSEFSGMFNEPQIPASPPTIVTTPPAMPTTTSFTSSAPPVPAFAIDPAHTLVPYSDRSKVVGGILNIVLPGVGRMYLGYVGTGIAQLFTTLCFGIGAVWSMIDGILILCGTVRADGMGRPLRQ
ncbi:MAG: DUF4339 domain-containing protein [Chthonomonas sp.]|nr:DUF4339 domain-containing protein [Chthonomonas sp.]